MLLIAAHKESELIPLFAAQASCAQGAAYTKAFSMSVHQIDNMFAWKWIGLTEQNMIGGRTYLLAQRGRNLNDLSPILLRLPSGDSNAKRTTVAAGCDYFFPAAELIDRLVSIDGKDL
jgi:hypothetical protein